jgi:hypothetical protein
VPFAKYLSPVTLTPPPTPPLLLWLLLLSLLLLAEVVMGVDDADGGRDKAPAAIINPRKTVPTITRDLIIGFMFNCC